jgi:hypothetical protein
MKEWFKKNIWNAISVIGTIATLVFGVYGLLFVPDYVKNAYQERQSAASIEIVNDLKEIIYSDLKYDSLIIPTLKKGKELKYDIIFPKSNREIIVEVQEDFLSDKFLPLGERMKLYNKADSLKFVTPSDKIQISKAESKASIFTILTYILSILSLIISGLLMLGLFTRRKQEINQELEKKFEEIQETRPDFVSEYRNFENLVGQALIELKLDFEDFTKNPKDSSFDFVIKLGNKKIGLEVKSKLGTDVLMKMRNQFDNSGLNALIIVTNRTVDFSTYTMLSDLHKKPGLAGRRFHFVSAINIEKLKNELSEIIRTEKE